MQKSAVPYIPQEELIPYRVSAYRVGTRSDTYILILHNSFFLEYILLMHQCVHHFNVAVRKSAGSYVNYIYTAGWQRVNSVSLYPVGITQ